MKKIIIISVVLSLIVPIGYFGYKEYQKQMEIKEYNQKVVKFQTKLRDINEITPDHFVELFMNNLKKAGPEDPMVKIVSMDPNMIDRQCAYFYKSGYEEQIKLCSEMLVYKGVIKNKEVQTPEEIVNHINSIRNGNMDKIDKMIVQTFDTSVGYLQTYLELEPQTYSF